jgi:hypothetical protein
MRYCKGIAERLWNNYFPTQAYHNEFEHDAAKTAFFAGVLISCEHTAECMLWDMDQNEYFQTRCTCGLHDALAARESEPKMVTEWATICPKNETGFHFFDDSRKCLLCGASVKESVGSLDHIVDANKMVADTPTQSGECGVCKCGHERIYHEDNKGSCNGLRHTQLCFCTQYRDRARGGR